MVVEAKLPVSCMLQGTVTWEGLPNVLWAMNREKGLAMFFGTQLIPVGDKIANGLANSSNGRMIPASTAAVANRSSPRSLPLRLLLVGIRLIASLS